jgi:RNA recognition motif-containing protein
MTIFVGNLSLQTTEKYLETLFAPFGDVKSVKVVTDNYTNRSRGFAFVEMPERGQAEHAIDKLNNASVHAKIITVYESSEKTHGTGPLSKRR